MIVSHAQPAQSVLAVDRVVLVKWSALGNNDVGQPYFAPRHSDRSIHVFGTFGSGGTVTIQGSNEAADPTDWQTLRDPANDNLIFTSAGLRGIMENTYQIRPSVVGDVTTDITVILMAKRVD